jgi:NDP-sugar pyrophosphorylase family protein
MQAVILCGGLGTRLKPLTERTPKSMVKVSGKPFLEHQLRLLARSNVKNIILCTGHLSENIESFFSDGSRLGVNLVYSQEKEPLGTGGALRNAGEHLQKEFFLLNGDTYIKINHQTLLRRFKACGALGILTVYDNSSVFYEGNVSLSTDGFVAEYEKSGCSLPYVDAGVSVFQKKIFEYFPRKKEFSLEKEVYSTLAKERKLAAYETSKPFFDIGTPERLKVFEDFLKKKSNT